MSGGRSRRERLKTQGDPVGIGESSVDYTGAAQTSVSREQPGGAAASSLADVEAMLKLQFADGAPASNSQMYSTAEERSVYQDPHGQPPIYFREGWAPIEGTSPNLLESGEQIPTTGNVTAEQSVQRHQESISSSTKHRNTRAANVRSQGAAGRRHHSKPRNTSIFKESFDLAQKGQPFARNTEGRFAGGSFAVPGVPQATQLGLSSMAGSGDTKVMSLSSAGDRNPVLQARAGPGTALNPLTNNLKLTGQMVKGNALLGKGAGAHAHVLLDGRGESGKNGATRAGFNATGNFKSIRASQQAAGHLAAGMDFGGSKSPLSGQSTEPQLVLLGQGAGAGESPRGGTGAPQPRPADRKLMLVSHVRDGKGGVQVGGVAHIETEDSLMLPLISSQPSQELPRGAAGHAEGSEESPLKQRIPDAQGLPQQQ